jgi:hypothetical protein
MTIQTDTFTTGFLDEDTELQVTISCDVTYVERFLSSTKIIWVEYSFRIPKWFVAHPDDLYNSITDMLKTEFPGCEIECNYEPKYQFNGRK